MVFDGIEPVQLPESIESARFVWFSMDGVAGVAHGMPGECDLRRPS